MLVFIAGEFRKNLASLARQFAASAGRRFEFQKSCQLFIGMHNETLSVVAMCISNEDYSSVRIHGLDAAPNSNRLC
jgi:hypothetical protein